MLYFDGTGLCLLAKRLEKHRFARPWSREGGAVMSLTLSELALFLEGGQLLEKKALAPPAFERKDLAMQIPA